MIDSIQFFIEIIYFTYHKYCKLTDLEKKPLA